MVLVETAPGNSSLSAAITAQLSEITDSASIPRRRIDPDYDLALSILQRELQTLQQTEHDAQIARSIGRAVDTDVQVVMQHAQRFQAENEQVQRDRAIAERLSRGEDVPETRGLPTRLLRDVTEDEDDWFKPGDEERSFSYTHKPEKHDRGARMKTEEEEVVMPSGPLFGNRLGRSEVTPRTVVDLVDSKSISESKPATHQIQVVKKRKVTKPEPKSIIDLTKPTHASKKQKPRVPPKPSKCHIKDTAALENELSQLQDILRVLATSIGWHDNSSTAATSSSRAAARPYKEELASSCQICSSYLPNHQVFTLSCNDRFCYDCMRQMVTMVVSKKTPFPARCCDAIPLSIVTEVLQEKELDTYLSLRDLHTATKQISCATCNKDLIHSNPTDTSAYCIACQKFTCNYCLKPLHDGLCPEDRDTKLLFETAKEQGWSFCEKCNHMVELTMGCYHMSCRCGHQFCYLCSAQWKTCQCPSSSESSVLGRTREGIQKGGERFMKMWKRGADGSAVLADFSGTPVGRELEEFRQRTERKHQEAMDLRRSVQAMRAEKEEERMVREQIAVLRVDITDLEAEIKVMQNGFSKKKQSIAFLVESNEAGLITGKVAVAKLLRGAARETVTLRSRKGKEKEEVRMTTSEAELKKLAERIMDFASA